MPKRDTHIQVPEKYADMLFMPHHVSGNHPQMANDARAAQFSSFAALSGFEEEIEETERLTDAREGLDSTQIYEINRVLNIIAENITLQPLVNVQYFLPDPQKEGGSYEEREGRVRHINADNKYLEFIDKSIIPFEDISAITIVDPAITTILDL